MRRMTLDAVFGGAAMPLVAVTVTVVLAMQTLTSASASAAEEVPSPATNASRASRVGDATAAWLELQRSNTAAAPALPTLGAEAGLAYERYLNSFKTKIPASFASPIEMRGSSFGDYGNGGGFGAAANSN